MPAMPVTTKYVRDRSNCGLSASVFSRDAERAERVRDHQPVELLEQETVVQRGARVTAGDEDVEVVPHGPGRGESLVVPYEELSVVSAPYEVDGRIGRITLG